ncbi:MAG: UDP-N-acetylglucosamine--N-acetylmuramyl-(pentapeptide) pyrophosphoryl-undecaprenol N-acetylglucosamine transferase, partial [Ruminococcus sp.]
MRILFAGGGTAGHINPALAIAGYVKKQNPDAEILFVGNKGGMEERLVPDAGFKFKSIVISGFKRSFGVKDIGHNIVTVKRMFTSSAASKKIIKEFKPDLAVGTGGYVSGPVLRTAAKMGVPIIIHEQNAYPGVTTKMLSKLAKKV